MVTKTVETSKVDNKSITSNKGKIGKGSRGKKRPPFSEEWRRNISEAKKGHIHWNKGQTGVYSSEALKKMSENAKHGENNWNWNGGRILLHGYIMIKIKTHPRADRKGYVHEHRLIMEKHLGRYLESNEIVHHKNGVRIEEIEEERITVGTVTDYQRRGRLQLLQRSAA
jgi:hypothetical protein